MGLVIKRVLLPILAVPVGALVLLLVTAIIYGVLGLPVDYDAQWRDCFFYAAGLLAGWWIWGASA